MDDYGLDPLIQNALDNNTLTLSGKRGISGGGIGVGAPITFPFKQGTPLSSDWTFGSGVGGGPGTGPGEPSWETHDGFVRLDIPAIEGSQGANLQLSIIRPFSLTNASVAIAFRMRINRASLNTAFQLGFDGGLQLARTSIPDTADAPSPLFYWLPSNGTTQFVAESAIAFSPLDSQWHQIVITIEKGILSLWEDDQLICTVTPPLLAPDMESVQVAFGLVQTASIPGAVGAQMDISDVIVLVGLNQEVHYNVPRSAQTDFAGSHNYLLGLAPLMSGLAAAASAVTTQLQSTPVGPGALFWGLSFSSQMSQALQTLNQSPQVVAFRNAAVAGAPGLTTNGTPTFYIGIALNASFIISGGYSLGFVIGPTETLAVLSVNVGLVTNAGVAAVVDIGLSPNPPSTTLGWGSYVQADAGEFFQVSVGVSGGIPLHIVAKDNCGPMFSVGAGVSALPIDIAGGFSYTWKMASL